MIFERRSFVPAFSAPIKEVLKPLLIFREASSLPPIRAMPFSSKPPFDHSNLRLLFLYAR
jgi:hypothetical protein